MLPFITACRPSNYCASKHLIIEAWIIPTLILDKVEYNPQKTCCNFLRPLNYLSIYQLLDPQFVQFSISCVRVCVILSLYIYIYIYIYISICVYIYIFVLLAFDVATMQDRQS